ncbi:MAG TPA: hypothetical protein VIY28_12860 [Pseudonocardiaceae bacterium]
MTRSYEPGTRLDASAQELFDWFNGRLLQEARKIAARRPDGNSRVSSSDILDSLRRQQERGRWRERAAFAAQVTLTALAISAAVMSFAIVRLVLGGEGTGVSDAVSSSRSLFTTVLLATLLIVATATLLAIFRESREGQSRIGKVRVARSSRRESEIALRTEWSDFEELMQRELYADPIEVPVQDLSDDIVRFSRRYDLDPEEIRSILRTRNAVAHDPRATSLREIRRNLLRLRSLLEKLSPLMPTTRQTLGS